MLIAVLVSLAIVIGGGGLWLGRGRGVRDEVDRFAAARSMTSRWAADPASVPKPVLDIAAHHGQPIPDQPTAERADLPN